MLPFGGGGVRRLLECLWRQMGACAGVPPRPLHTWHIRGQGTWLASLIVAEVPASRLQSPSLVVASYLPACQVPEYPLRVFVKPPQRVHYEGHEADAEGTITGMMFPVLAGVYIVYYSG